MVEQVAQQQSGVGGEHGVADVVQVQFARRPQARRQLAVIALVVQIELMRRAQRLACDLPDAHGVVADHDALARAAQNDVSALGALLPDRVGQVAVDVHIVIFHGADAHEVIQRQVVEVGDFEDVRGQLRGLLARQRPGRGIAVVHHAIVGLRLEDQELRQLRKHLGRADRFELLVRRHIVCHVEHVALLLVIVVFLLRPGLEFIMRDEVASLQAGNLWHGGKQIVIGHQENLVLRPLLRVCGRQVHVGGVATLASFAPAQILKTQKGFELVVKCRDFHRRNFQAERNNQPVVLHDSHRHPRMRGSRQVQGPEAIVGVPAGSKSEKSGGQAKRVAEQFFEETLKRHGLSPPLFVFLDEC